MSTHLDIVDITDTAPLKATDTGPELTEAGQASLEEVVEAIKDLERRGTTPILRRVVHRTFERSIKEFFIEENASSMQLPSDLIRHTVPDPDGIPLPEPEALPDMALVDALTMRRSKRNLANEPLTMQELGTVLHMAFRANGAEDGYGTRGIPLLPYPTIGGLDPAQVGVVINRVEGLELGYYHYDKVGHALVPVLSGDLRLPLLRTTFENEWLFYAPVVMVLANDQRKVYWKYKSRGYRISNLDVGGAMQNLYLSCTATDLSCCAIAGYDDEKINALFGYRDGDVSVCVLMTVGHPAERAPGTRRN